MIILAISVKRGIITAMLIAKDIRHLRRINRNVIPPWLMLIGVREDLRLKNICLGRDISMEAEKSKPKEYVEYEAKKKELEDKYMQSSDNWDLRATKDNMYDEGYVESLRAGYEELKKKIEQLMAEADLRDMDIDDFKEEIRQKADYIHKLEGKVEAYEYCIKNGRGK